MQSQSVSPFLNHSFHASLQYREALLRLMVDVSVMLGANEQTAEAQMKPVLDFEMKLAQVSSKTLENLRLNSFKSLALRKKTVLSGYFNGVCALLQILIPYENRTSENMYNKYSLSKLHRTVPDVSALLLK